MQCCQEQTSYPKNLNEPPLNRSILPQQDHKKSKEYLGRFRREDYKRTLKSALVDLWLRLAKISSPDIRVSARVGRKS